MILGERCLGVLMAGAAVLLAPSANAQTPTVDDPSGQVIRTSGPPGSTIDVPPGSAGIASPCAEPALPGVIYRESHRPSVIVDSCGRQSAPPGQHVLPETMIGGGATSITTRVVIDRMTTSWSSFGPGVQPSIDLFGSANTYFLSDGTSWSSGAGSFRLASAALDHVETSGDLVRYYFTAPSDGVLYQQTDYDAGDHSAQGTLGGSEPLLLEATRGSPLAVMRGQATIVSNDATWYGEPRFNYYAAPVGSLVPFELHYTLSSPAGWTEDTFEGSMSYSMSGSISFVDGVSLPPLAEVTISGPPQVVGTSTFEYHAIARYENSALREVTSTALWTVEPSSLASIEQGLLTTLPLSTPQETLTIGVTYSEGDITRTAEKQVLYRAFVPGPAAESWPMYQANERHTGYQPVTLDPTQFALLWQTAVGQQGFPLNPVTAAEGRVFCSLNVQVGPSLFALEAESGTELWSKTFSGGPFSVNPPSFGYGNVYIQTGDHADDTWLHAFDAETGAFVFKSPHGAQWERYYAPTISEGKVYINGGYYGGAYGFDAFTGAEQWFTGLPQYDEWTPAIDGDLVYCYVGEYQPGLYVLQRATGAVVDMIPDPNFDWNGWSMDLAPVVGAHSDVIVIHDGRLINFDTASGTIRWELEGGFSGQPSVAHDTIFAIQGGGLAVLDEVTYAPQWSWHPPQGQLSGTLIATDTHVFGATSQAVYAIDLASHQSSWSFPMSGHLALGNGTLYVAGSTGQLAAIRVTPPNSAPDCSAAAASVAARAWPPKHRLERLIFSGITDPEDDPVTISVTGITQDEPPGSTCPDAVIDPDGTAWIRVEREWPGNGRVYVISFTARDSAGATSNGQVTVSVPPVRGASSIDDGQAFDSLDCGGNGAGRGIGAPR
jgi:outer membrane protein assembly factor BamB